MLFPYRKESAAQSLGWFLFLVAWLLLTNTCELFAPAGNRTLLFTKLEYLSYSYIPVVWLSFCLRYTGWITYTRKNLLLTAIIAPALIFIIVLTNDYHGLIWKEVGYFKEGNLSVLRPVYGSLFWVLMVYNWGLIGLGTIVVFRSHFSGQKLFHRQSTWILMGSILPGVANAIHIFGLVPGLNKDFTPIGFALSGLFFIAGMYYHRLFWVMPVARGIILQELNIGILVINPVGLIIDHNKKIDSLFDLDEISVGRSISEYPGFMYLFRIAQFVLGERREAVNFGQVQWKDSVLSYSIQPVQFGSENTIVTVEDITKQMSLQMEVTKIKTEFINREKLASIGQLTAGLAHEINNPLGYLKSDVRSLERMIEAKCANADDPDSREIVTITKGITEGLGRIENVILSLLSFSRQGKIETTIEKYDLCAGIDTTLDIMRYELKDMAEIKKEYMVLPAINARKNEINQVIFNILSNALQAIKERYKPLNRRGTITIRTGISNDYAFCEIENDGTPIRPEIRAHMFELFFTTKPENWGTGLGLNLSRNIIEQRHHGSLQLISLDPVIFRIKLPTKSM